jgi:transcriptional regulator with XRE-family HTH domain
MKGGDSMNFGKVKELRIKKGWTQEELAVRVRSLGVKCTREWISKVENGKGNCTIDVLNKIAEALGTETKKVI